MLPTTPRGQAGADGDQAGLLYRYVEAAINSQVERIGPAPLHHQNKTLFTGAVALGQLVGAGVVDLDTATAVLLNAAASHITAGAYSVRQARATITSGLRRGRCQSRQLPEPVTQLGGVA